MNNPFNINFGKEPNSLISRENDLFEVYDSFSSNNPFSNVFIITGIRGSGKTVAMTNVINHFSNDKNWISIRLNPESDMLEQLASKLYDGGKLKKLFLSKEFTFSFNGLSVSIKGTEPISNVSTFLEREFEYLKRKKIKVLISIDEAVSNSFMSVFVHEFQSLLCNDYSICLIMTGLYHNISLIENQKSLTFLYRAPKIYLGSLNMRAIANSYKNIFDLSEEEAILLAKFTKGYAFAYQLLGNIMYERNKKYIDEEVIQKFDEIIQERAYSIIYNELTKVEKNILKKAIVDNKNSSIISTLNISKSQLSNYKKKLSKDGIIEEDSSEIIFKLPRFSDFIKFMIMLEE